MRATPKTRLVQKVLRQLIETYGFDRKDIRTRYRLTTAGRRQTVDIVIFRRGREALDERVERVIVCQPQKLREKLRSPQEAAAETYDETQPTARRRVWVRREEPFEAAGQAASTAGSPSALKAAGSASRRLGP